MLNGGIGRPAYYIPQSQIEAMMELRFTYEKMARFLLVHFRDIGMSMDSQLDVTTQMMSSISPLGVYFR